MCANHLLAINHGDLKQLLTHISYLEKANFHTKKCVHLILHKEFNLGSISDPGVYRTSSTFFQLTNIVIL